MIFIIIIPIIIILLGMLMIMEHPITIYGVISIIIFSICTLTIIGFSFLDGSNEEYGVNFIPFFVITGYIPLIIASKKKDKKEVDRNDL